MIEVLPDFECPNMHMSLINYLRKNNQQLKIIPHILWQTYEFPQNS